MKKYLAVFLSGIFLFTHVITSYAGITLKYDGQYHDYNGRICKIKINDELLSSDIPPVIINNRTLVPVKTIFDKLGAQISWDQKNHKVTITSKNTNILLEINNQTAYVNNSPIKMDTAAKIINDRAYVPIGFVAKEIGMDVIWDDLNSTISINDKTKSQNYYTLNSVTYSKSNSSEDVSIKLSDKPHYNIITSIANKIIIDFSSTELVFANKKQDVQSTSISSIRCGQFTDNITRVVIDTKEAKANYNIKEQTNGIILSIPNKIINSNTNSDDSLTSRGDFEREIEPNPIGNALTVNYSILNNNEQIILNISSYKNYNIFRLSEPNRIIIDIPESSSSRKEQKIITNGNLSKSIRYAQSQKGASRVVIDTIGQPNYKTIEQNGKLIIELSTPSYNNISYSNVGDGVRFILKGATLTEGMEDEIKLYQDKYENPNRFVITFPSNLADLGEGTMTINDGYIKSVDISKNTTNSTTSIAFNTKNNYYFQINTRSNLNDTEITVLKTFNKTDKLVVIDAGHGGSESGAVYGGIEEKNLNLDISLRLNKLLKSNGIKTYMIREDDRYVGLFERAYIANNLNASLFLSIHNNAFDSSFSGTETLYFPQNSNDTSFNGKRFAEIVQNKLVTTLNTKARSIVERPNLVVLRATTMPSALAEIAFMTNEQDLANLKTEEFRQKAAKALCDAIMQALSEMN